MRVGSKTKLLTTCRWILSLLKSVELNGICWSCTWKETWSQYYYKTWRWGADSGYEESYRLQISVWNEEYSLLKMVPYSLVKFPLPSPICPFSSNVFFGRITSTYSSLWSRLLGSSNVDCSVCCLLFASSLFSLLFVRVEGDSKFLRNVINFFSTTRPFTDWSRLSLYRQRVSSSKLTSTLTKDLCFYT